MANTPTPTTYENLPGKIPNTALDAIYIAENKDTQASLIPKISVCFNQASTLLTTLTKDTSGVKSYKDESVQIINPIIETIQNYISQGLINLRNVNLLKVADKDPNLKAGGSKKSKNNKKNRNQDGGAIPDLVNNVAAFQNMGGLLATASPLDNAQRVEPAIYNAESFNAGIFMPVSSSSGLPDNYKLGMDQPLQPLQGGGKKSKNNKNNKK